MSGPGAGRVTFDTGHIMYEAIGLEGSADDAKERRRAWRARREEMEAKPNGTTWGNHVRRTYHHTAHVAGRLIAPTRFGKRAAAKALKIGLTELSFEFPDLPAAFDGYTILQLTDLHLDNIEGTGHAAARRVAGIEADLCVITGDVRDNIRAPIGPVLDDLADVLSGVRVRDGILGILGNHDSAAMVDPMEQIGVRMLLNETVVIERRGERIHITGTDDVHLFHTEEADRVLASAPHGFCIALVHSPEVAHHAAARHRLYLCGHTHGGQICLPGGRPIITGLKRHRKYARGHWEHDGMTGYTCRGIGASLLPTRFNCEGEVVLITLRRGPHGSPRVDTRGDDD